VVIFRLRTVVKLNPPKFLPGSLFTITDVTAKYSRINKKKLKIYLTTHQAFATKPGNQLDIQLWQMRVELKNMARNFKDCIWILQLSSLPPINRGGFTLRDAEIIIRETHGYFVPRNTHQLVIYPHKMGPFGRSLAMFVKSIAGKLVWAISPNVIFTYSWEEADQHLKRLLSEEK
jgi:hypothetical protein